MMDYYPTPIDLAPSDHTHNWQLAKFTEGKPMYRTVAIGMSTYDRKVGKYPDVSLYVCECGKKKEVKHEENKDK